MKLGSYTHLKTGLNVLFGGECYTDDDAVVLANDGDGRTIAYLSVEKKDWVTVTAADGGAEVAIYVPGARRHG